ncbi:hypothetical protein [Mycobacterium angelicum]|nr:hypothetical protein [Mycobacterium angelicum]
MSAITEGLVYCLLATTMFGVIAIRRLHRRVNALEADRKNEEQR